MATKDFRNQVYRILILRWCGGKAARKGKVDEKLANVSFGAALSDATLIATRVLRSEKLTRNSFPRSRPMNMASRS